MSSKRVLCSALMVAGLTSVCFGADRLDPPGRYTWQSKAFVYGGFDPRNQMDAVGGFRICLGNEIPESEDCERKIVRESTRLEVKKRGLNSDADVRGVVSPDVLASCSAVRIGDPALALHQGRFISDAIDHFEYHNNIEVGSDDHAMFKLSACKHCDLDLTFIAVSGAARTMPEILSLTACTKAETSIFGRALNRAFRADREAEADLDAVVVKKISGSP